MLSFVSRGLYMDMEEKADFSSRFQCTPLIRFLQFVSSNFPQTNSPGTPVSNTSVVLNDCLCHTKAMALPFSKKVWISARGLERCLFRGAPYPPGGNRSAGPITLESLY